MWHKLFASPEADPDFAASAMQLLQSTARNTVAMAAGLAGVALCVRTFGVPGDTDLVAMPALAAAVLMSLAALWLLPRRLIPTVVGWQVGLGLLVLAVLALLQQPAIGLLYAFFPLLAVVTLGWPAALFSGSLVAGLAWCLTQDWAGALLPVGYVWAITAGALISGLLGWAAMRALYTVTQWSIHSFQQAERQLEEARNQRVEFRQIQEDLMHANRELARLSDRLKAMYEVAEESRRVKEEFVANVSHELRTPLNMIVGFSDMILHAPQVYASELPPALMADITAIQRNSQHLARLVDDVLDLSQVEAGKMVLTKEWVGLDQIVEAAALAVRALFESKGLYLRTVVPGDLPPVFCDSTRIRQVILNLLSNAGRFTDRGGVEVKAWRDPQGIVVSVSDTGPGIPAANQDKLFQPFQQIDSSPRRAHGGTGLGLSISKRFIEMHEGKMWLESPAPAASAQNGGPGATFFFTLPVTSPISAGGPGALRWLNPHQPYEARTRESKAPASTPLARFVLLDRADSLLRRFRPFLGNAELTWVRDLDEARHELGRSPAKALLVNALSCPEIPGDINPLRDLPYQTPVISFWVPTEDQAARRLGVVRYLVKPITRDALLSALASLGPEVSTVLLVDDEPDIIRLLSRHMAGIDRPYRVIRAYDGQRALDLLRERRPDVMLLDLILPGADGFQVLREKHEDPAICDIPVIVISSRDPIGQPIVSDTVTICRGHGLSIRDLAACAEALSAVLTPSASTGDPALPETRGG